jgi:hypothetical protein
MALEGGLDLVEVAPNVQPPVCRVMDYKKFKAEQQKRREKENGNGDGDGNRFHGLNGMGWDGNDSSVERRQGLA